MSQPTTADRVSSVIAMVVAAAAAIFGIMPALLLAMASDMCSTGCSYPLMTAGWFIAVIAPPLIAVVGFILTAVALLRNRRASQRAWVFVAAQVGSFALGYVMVVAGTRL